MMSRVTPRWDSTSSEPDTLETQRAIPHAANSSEFTTLRRKETYCSTGLAKHGWWETGNRRLANRGQWTVSWRCWTRWQVLYGSLKTRHVMSHIDLQGPWRPLHRLYEVDWQELWCTGLKLANTERWWTWMSSGRALEHPYPQTPHWPLHSTPASNDTATQCTQSSEYVFKIKISLLCIP